MQFVDTEVLQEEFKIHNTEIIMLSKNCSMPHSLLDCHVRMWVGVILVESGTEAVTGLY